MLKKKRKSIKWFSSCFLLTLLFSALSSSQPIIWRRITRCSEVTGDNSITAALRSECHRFLPFPAVCGELSSSVCVPQRWASIALVGGRRWRCFWFKRWIVGVIINELVLCHCSNSKNREKREAEEIPRFAFSVWRIEKKKYEGDQTNGKHIKMKQKWCQLSSKLCTRCLETTTLISGPQGYSSASSSSWLSHSATVGSDGCCGL